MHTPAPWKNIGREIRHAEKSMILATVYNHLPANQQPAEAEANARLIAAAPELLEALKVAQAWLSNIRTDQKGLNILVDAMPRDDYGLEKLRAAIAKAEGK